MSTKHWGEIQNEENNDFIPDVTPDIERSMHKLCLSEYEDDDVAINNERIVLPSMDPLILYAISLHKYNNDMIEMINLAEFAANSDIAPASDAAHPIPEMPEIFVRHMRNNLNYIPKDFTPFSQGMPVDVPDITEAVAKQILNKCIVTLFAHVGFETTHTSVLDVLTDVLETFLKKFSENLKIAAEDENNHGSTFPHTIERVLTETGLGGVKGLNDYYQCRVVKYINVLQKRCKELNDLYATLLIPKSPPSLELSNDVRIKVEEDDDVMELDNPVLHFTTIDGYCSTLESGYQLLNSLEAVANMQSFTDADDDIVNSSAGAVSIPPENELSHLSFTKKTKFK